MLLLKIDRRGKPPIASQIFTQIQTLIQNDSLKTGAALPSTRELAQKLGVNRSTVSEAYQELWTRGHTESRPGSYTRVRKRPKLSTHSGTNRNGLIDWERKATEPSKLLLKDYEESLPGSGIHSLKHLINLNRFDLDCRLFPLDKFRKCLNKVLDEKNAHLLQYGNIQGYRRLREFVAERSRIHGIAIGPEQIMITNGAQQALDLIFRLLTVPGKIVAIESPTYLNFIPLMRYYRVRALEIPMKTDGLDLAHLKRALKKTQLAFLYTMPNFQNPTGITTSQDHREKLLSICEMHQIPIVEDGFEEEMKYFGKVALSIKSMDENKIVIYIGTFSKVLFPGIRVGWIAAEEECIKRLRAIKRFEDLSPNNVLQAAVYEFCAQGHYDLHIRRMHRIFRKRMQAALTALDKDVPKENIKWTVPNGGYLIWVELAVPPENEEFFRGILRKHGLYVAPGNNFFYRKGSRLCFRISISMLDEKEIDAAILGLGRAVKELNHRLQDWL